MKSKESSARVRYAVVGLGNIAQVAVLPAFAHARENSELVALVSSDEKKLRELRKRYDVHYGGSYDELETVFNEASVDAAYIAVPNALHREVVERCARAGVHVLCEKPMGETVADCEAMIAATKENGVKLMIAYRLHFDPANLRVIGRILKGEIGAPRIFSSVFSQQVREGDIRTQPEMGGGAIYDMGVYCINAARYLFRAEPIEVYAQRVEGTDPRFQRVDEMTCAVLRFSEGRIAQMIASQGASEVSEFRVVGTEGDIRLEPAYGYSSDLCEHYTVKGKTKEKTYTVHDQFAPELVYFSNCVLNGEAPEPSGEEGLADVRVLEAIMESARTGQTVKLPAFARAARPSPELEMKKPKTRHVTTVHAPSPSR